MDLPLPRAHRKIGPLDLRSAIKTLAWANPWHLHEDADPESNLADAEKWN